jgi:hypothetical protein
MNDQPRRYEILKPIWLAFHNGHEQYDQEVKPGMGYLQFNDCDILWTHQGKTLLSDTSNWLLTEWLGDGRVRELPLVRTP